MSLKEQERNQRVEVGGFLWLGQVGSWPYWGREGEGQVTLPRATKGQIPSLAKG